MKAENGTGAVSVISALSSCARLLIAMAFHRTALYVVPGFARALQPAPGVRVRLMAARETPVHPWRIPGVPSGASQ